jgi:hypothetical protein
MSETHSETWYVLADGGLADPRDVVRDADGALRHRDGRPVALAPHGPRTRSVDPAAERAPSPAPAPAEAPAAVAATPEARAVEAEGPRRRYRTREAQAE